MGFAWQSSEAQGSELSGNLSVLELTSQIGNGCVAGDFGAAAPREEEEYPSWIFDRRVTPLQRQRSGSGRCSLVIPTRRDGYAPSSRVVSRPPELSALIPYLRDGF
jgi:hypothetical protein